jgi:hypothetical protein
MARTYKAVEVSAPGSLRVVERTIPEPGPGQVRIRVEACGICHTDEPAEICLESTRLRLAYICINHIRVELRRTVEIRMAEMTGTRTRGLCRDRGSLHSNLLSFNGADKPVIAIQWNGAHATIRALIGPAFPASGLRFGQD